MTISILSKLKTYYTTFVKNRVNISSHIVGTKIKPYLFHVSFRHTSNYAASIFDENSIYYNTEKETEIIAHPLFPVRISWEIIENLNQLWEIEFPGDLQHNLIHQSEYLQIFRLIKPGDELTIHGELVALVPHKSGVKIILKLDYYDNQNQLVLTEYTGAIAFGAKCSDKGTVSVDLPVTERKEVNSAIWEEKISIPGLAPYIYDGCNNIISPIHTDPKFARSMGLPNIILQGTATLAKSVTTVIKKEMKNNPRQVEIISGKFTGMVVPPNRISVRLLKREPQKIYFDVADQSANFVLKGGFIKIR